MKQRLLLHYHHIMKRLLKLIYSSAFSCFLSLLWPTLEQRWKINSQKILESGSRTGCRKNCLDLHFSNPANKARHILGLHKILYGSECQ